MLVSPNIATFVELIILVLVNFNPCLWQRNGDASGATMNRDAIYNHPFLLPVWILHLFLIDGIAPVDCRNMPVRE